MYTNLYHKLGTDMNKIDPSLQVHPFHLSHFLRRLRKCPPRLPETHLLLLVRVLRHNILVEVLRKLMSISIHHCPQCPYHTSKAAALHGSCEVKNFIRGAIIRAFRTMTSRQKREFGIRQVKLD